MLQRFRFILLLATLATHSVMAQGTAEVWLSKAVGQFQNKGVEVVFRINEEGMKAAVLAFVNFVLEYN